MKEVVRGHLDDLAPGTRGQRRSLDRKFDEVREICGEEGYALEVDQRRDRESAQAN